MDTDDESWEAQISAIAVLGEPTRRLLYDHVVRQPAAVSRDEAAAALELPRTTAAFHLDQLVDHGLLDVRYERRTGRTGPGAGRPAKLYLRSQRQVVVSLPQRHYDLAGRLLATCLEEAERSGDSPREVLHRRAHQLGQELGESVRPATGSKQARDVALGVLEAYGYEPRLDGPRVTLGNCPFHTLAQQHTELVCGMNLRLLDGLLDVLPDTGWTAHLAPAPDRCCVHFESAAGGRRS